MEQNTECHVVPIEQIAAMLAADLPAVPRPTYNPMSNLNIVQSHYGSGRRSSAISSSSAGSSGSPFFSQMSSLLSSDYTSRRTSDDASQGSKPNTKENENETQSQWPRTTEALVSAQQADQKAEDDHNGRVFKTIISIKEMFGRFFVVACICFASFLIIYAVLVAAFPETFLPRINEIRSG